MSRIVNIPLLWTTAACLCLLLASGCALEVADDAAPSALSFCSVNEECQQGEVCEGGFCVVQTEVKELVAVQLTPSNNGDVLAEQFPQVEMEQGQPMPILQFQQPKLLFGRVRVAGTDQSDEPVSINARLLLRRIEPNISGVPLFYEVESKREEGYVLRLPGGIYDITILPESDELPPERVQNLPISVDTQYDITIGGTREAITVAGRMIFTNARNEADQPVSGARVVAIDERDSTVSTAATTDEDGNFVLTVRQNVDQIRLVLDPTDKEPLLPRVITEDIRLTGREVTLGNLSLGVVQPEGQRVRGTLLGQDDGKPVTDASMVFRTALGDGLLVANTITDDQGNFVLELPPGTYTVRVLPPSNSTYALTELPNLQVRTLDDGQTSPFIDLEIPSKVLVRGKALAPSGDRALFNATIRMTGVEVAGSGDSVRTYSARTNQDGSFEVAIDPGVYDIELIPTDTNGFARAFLYGVELSQPVNEQDLFASRSNLARGVIIDPNNVPTPDILVEIFRLDTDRGPTLVGSGLTNAQGEYRLLVPALRIQ